jgi:hypothetical protein
MGENNHGLLEKPEAALENIISALPDGAGQCASWIRRAGLKRCELRRATSSRRRFVQMAADEGTG